MAHRIGHLPVGLVPLGRATVQFGEEVRLGLGQGGHDVQVQRIGRAGRGEEPGAAIIQTLYPGHYSIRHARRQDYRAFFQDELTFRRAMHYPPHVALTSGIVRASTIGAAMADAGAIVRALKASERDGHFQALGPAPAPFVKLRGEHRAQFFLKGGRRAAMRDAIRRALEALPDLRRGVIIDVDPMTVL